MSVEPLLRGGGISWSPVTRRAGEREVLSPLDFETRSGECVAVVGPNGAAKTTLLRLLAGLLAPSTGELTWEGVPYGRLSRRELARHIAYVPQIRPARIPLTVEQLVLLGRYPYLSPLQMAPDRGDLECVTRVLDRSGLTALRRRPLDGLSGGERQSVFIAAALAQEAEVLLLDEPTTHLDPRHQLDVVRVLVDLRANGGPAIVLTTHDINLAARLADRIVALRAGAVVAQGTPRDLVRPERLHEVFGAPFDAVGNAEEPRVVLRLDR
jgi:iron complex transport system ATP-binding protein